MGLGSLWCTEQLWDEEEEDGGREEEEEVEIVCDEEEEEELEEGGLMPTNPLTRLKRGSAHRLLLQLVAGSRVKRPV